MVNNGLPRSITKCFVSNVESYAFMTRTCLATIWHICVFVSTTGCSVRSCVISTLGLLLSSDERVWGLLVSTTGCRSMRRNSFFVKRSYIDLLGTGRFSSILHSSRVSSNNGLPRSIGSNNGLPRSITTWIWNWLVRLETSR